MGCARLHGGVKGVVLALVDGVSGLVWPPVTVDGEEARGPWAKLCRRARAAGLDVHAVHGVPSDGAPGLEAFRRRVLPWGSHQRCISHLWRGLAGAFAQAVATAATGLTGAAAKAVRAQTRRVLVALVRAVFDASSWAAAEAALTTLAAHDLGAALATAVQAHLEAALYHLCDYSAGLLQVSPEWIWRDFRLRLSHGRNHGQDRRLERAALVWAIYCNFEPAQGRYERKRTDLLEAPRPVPARRRRGASRRSALPRRLGHLTAPTAPSPFRLPRAGSPGPPRRPHPSCLPTNTPPTSPTRDGTESVDQAGRR
jgi:hypothetical protein